MPHCFLPGSKTQSEHVWWDLLPANMMLFSSFQGILSGFQRDFLHPASGEFSKCSSIPDAPWCWNIYLYRHLPEKWPSSVIKSSSTMLKHLGIVAAHVTSREENDHVSGVGNGIHQGGILDAVMQCWSCLWTYIYIYMHMYLYMCMHVYAYVHVHVYVYVHVYVDVDVTHICKWLCIWLSICRCRCLCI